MDRGINVGWSKRLVSEGASNALAQRLEPLEADTTLRINGAHGYGVGGVWQCHVCLGHARGNFAPLVSLAVHCTVSGAHREFVPHEGIFRGHDSLVNHSLAGSCVPDSEEVQYGYAAGYVSAAEIPSPMTCNFSII